MESLIGFLKSGKKGNQNEQSPRVPEQRSSILNSGRSKQKQSVKAAGIQQNLNNIFSYDDNENIDSSSNPISKSKSAHPSSKGLGAKLGQPGKLSSHFGDHHGSMSNNDSTFQSSGGQIGAISLSEQ